MNDSPRARIPLGAIRAKDRWFTIALRLAALPVPLLLAAVIVHLVVQAGGPSRAPVPLADLLRGTLTLSLAATAAALPPALAGALASRRILSRRSREALCVALDGFSAMPMVALGFLFATRIGPLVGPLAGLPALHPAIAASAMACGLLPALWRRFLAAFDAVPGELQVGGLALGVAPRKVLLTVELPAAMPSLARSVAEGLARCAGESVIVLMVSGNAATSWGGGDGAAALAPALLAMTPESVPGSPGWAAAHRVALALVALCVGLHVAGRSFQRGRSR